MKLFVFQGLDQVSDNYHANGSVVIIAKDKREADFIAKATGDIELDWKKVKKYPVEAKVATIWVFPNAGCC